MSGYNANFKNKNKGSTQTTSFLNKNLPINLDAEKAVLAAILLNGNNLTLVSDILKPLDFYDRSHQIIYETMLEVGQGDHQLDLLVLQDSLEKKQQLQSAGGLVYLIELQENIPAIGMIIQHAKIVKDKSILRDLINSASEIISTCYDQDIKEIDAVLDSSEKKIFQISNKLVPPTFLKMDELLKRTFKNLAQMKSSREGVTGVPSGFTEFDRMTCGMQKGDLLILAARPSMGKTALAMDMAINAWKAGFAVGVFSLEMSSEQLVLRLLASQSRISNTKIRNASVTSDEWMQLTNSAAQLAEAKIFIDDSPGLNIMELRAKARKLKAKSKIDFIVIDYLQLINGSGNYENRTQEISTISRSLKALAKELDIPVLALSQLSRSLESRMDKRPLLSDLRESGAIEQDGDVIFFVYRDVVYNSETENPDHAEIIIGKQRNGPIGAFNVKFQGEFTHFSDLNNDEY
ncbi:replicative DNA helicase [Candidatus Dependentiae bacterium]|nr:replicative DNA helicase [Candidatus Dependentiae bacterium]MBU4387090.1 replicative DNA helicase [Candidatus Dependentiae bacterium]MCG2756241.1 replicative DNA helicase [Candidatus Dependentiae bacterium]